ncbi:SCO family protein (plasmid) [Haloferacaceae archaeon DSL9]
MRRRAYLGAVGSVGGGLVAGCLGGDDSETILDRPEYRGDDPERYPYPIHGASVPEATLPSPLHDDVRATDSFVGTGETLLTFVFSRCHTVCPALTANLAQVQAQALSSGYGDEVMLMPITFDPTHDTPDVIRSFSTRVGADVEHESWQFLRPESESDARTTVEDTFGVRFQRNENYDGSTDEAENDELATDGGHNESITDGDHNESTTMETENDESETGGHAEMAFTHANLLLLVNRDGYVERAYTGEVPNASVVISDLERVREGFE